MMNDEAYSSDAPTGNGKRAIIIIIIIIIITWKPNFSSRESAC